jgi:GT2 family glycosyltransferase
MSQAIREDLESQVRAAQEEITRLKADLRASERNLAYVLELLSQHQSLLNTHQATIVRLDRVFTDVTNGRLWRTLRAAGGVVKRFLPVPGNENGNGRRNTYLVCDEPQPNDTVPRSGIVRIRGWALADGGVDSVQLEIPGVESQTTTTHVLRPDIKKLFPELDTKGRSGFLFEVDTSSLPKGRHPFTLRLFSHGAEVREVRGFIEIDHEKGFASDYERWIQEFEIPENGLIGIKVKGLVYQPLISILMPVFNSKPDELTAAIDSVFDQSYPNWELCIADDGSTNPAVREILEQAKADPRSYNRIKVIYRNERGGISRACNSARSMATGEFFCFLDHDDLLSPHALAYVCEAVNQFPQADVFYSDEDKIDEAGRRTTPFFKPDWSPDTILSLNYICHLFVIRRDLAEAVGDLDPACDGGQDYDFILRASEQAAHIEHIPRVLYHWRVSGQSTATTIDNKGFAIAAAQHALAAHAGRTGLPITISNGLVPGRWRVRYPIPEGTQVSIVIASGGKADVLRTNLDSIFEKTTYRHYEVVIADNSKGNLIEKLSADYVGRHPNLRYFDWRDKPFNFSLINNSAARSCQSPVLLFLNDDTSVLEPGWLDAMLELAMRPEVGAVGAKLLYPTGGIQHGGVMMGVYDNCGHAFKGLDGLVSHYFDFSDVIRNVSAVTGACLMTRSEVFWQVGGFDEAQFAVAFNDIDLCLKIGKAGYRVLYTPHAVLYHHEAFSKTSKDLIPHPDEVAAMRSKWSTVIAHDPYYSPNLTRNDENYTPRTRA